MPLNFPNPCCSFDSTKNRVDFWGYDNVIEVTFHVETDALKKLCPQTGDNEAGYLQAFDTVRNRIYDVAEKVYLRGRKRSYAHSLAAKDF